MICDTVFITNKMSVTMLQCCNVKYVKLEDFEDEFKNINTISEYKNP